MSIRIQYPLHRPFQNPTSHSIQHPLSMHRSLLRGVLPRPPKALKAMFTPKQGLGYACEADSLSLGNNSTPPKINSNMQIAMKILLDEVVKDLPSKNLKDFISKNFVCSPLSLDAMLNMVAFGSKGRTLEQLMKFIGTNGIDDLKLKSEEIMNVASNKKAIDEKNDGGGEPIVSFVNGVWVNQRYTLRPSYEEFVKGVYNAEARAVDFENEADQVVEDVNSWVKDSTKGLIKEIIPPQSLDNLTSFVLANALYFKGVWAQNFPKYMTRERKFYLLNGETISAPFIDSDEDYYDYRCFDDYKVLMLPYQEGSSERKFSMYFFLPKEKKGLRYLIQKLNSKPGFLQESFDLKEERLGDFGIPKFKFSYMFEGSETLKKLGVTLPFEFVNELTGIVESPIGYEPCISHIFHKSYIEIDEKGTEAAASTVAVGLAGCSMNFEPPPLPSFVANKPFLFMIREELSRAVFFVGAVLNPLLVDE